MDTTSDLVQIVLIILGTNVGILALLFMLATIDPKSDRRRVAQPKAVRPRANP